jgi:hypothetical protein
MLWQENFKYQKQNTCPNSSRTTFGSLKTEENLGDQKN